ncbi:MAG: hypothetical protein ABIO70_09830 [Pseudomonadota bacterium]
MPTFLKLLDPLGLGLFRTIIIEILTQVIDMTRDYPEAAAPDERRGVQVSTSGCSWQLPAFSSGGLLVGRWLFDGFWRA